MHFIVHWGPQSGHVVPAGIQSELMQVLAPYSWFRPLANFYIVNVTSSDHYYYISRTLTAVASRQPNQAWLIISPPMTGGQYHGWLPQNMWPQINERSQ